MLFLCKVILEARVCVSVTRRQSNSSLEASNCITTTSPCPVIGVCRPSSINFLDFHHLEHNVNQSRLNARLHAVYSQGRPTAVRAWPNLHMNESPLQQSRQLLRQMLSAVYIGARHPLQQEDTLTATSIINMPANLPGCHRQSLSTSPPSITHAMHRHNRA
jgi:hypothetical protein